MKLVNSGDGSANVEKLPSTAGRYSRDASGIREGVTVTDGVWVAVEVDARVAISTVEGEAEGG